MDDSDDSPVCPHCGTHFSNRETLAKHMAVIHKIVPAAEPSAAAAATTGSSDPSGGGGSKKKQKRPRAESDDDDGGAPSQSENVELEPLLGVLSDAQKDALILRAVQSDPDFYERIIEQATIVLTEESAEARVASMDGEAITAALRFYLQQNVPANALTLLSAASQRTLTALEELSADGGEGGGGGGESGEGSAEGGGEEQSDKKEELLAAVEAAPAAGLIGALWEELFANAYAAKLIRERDTAHGSGILELLEGIQSAAAAVRSFAAATLVGPNGETLAKLADAEAALGRVVRG